MALLNTEYLAAKSRKYQHYVLNPENIFLPLRCPAMHVVSWSVRLVWYQVSYFAPSSDEYKENQAPEDQNYNHDNCTCPIHCPEYCKNMKIKMCFMINKIPTWSYSTYWVCAGCSLLVQHVHLISLTRCGEVFWLSGELLLTPLRGPDDGLVVGEGQQLVHHRGLVLQGLDTVIPGLGG